jgi:RHS repeat-associated protein
VKRYATHDFDAVLGMYYAKARFYDAENRRFASMDPVKGEITDPLTMVQYIYAIDCPLVYIDLGGERADPPSTDGGNKNNTSAKPAVPKPSTPKASDATKGATSGLKGPTNSNNGVTSGVNGAVSGAGMSPTSDRGTKYIVNASAGLKLRSIANLFGRVIMVLPYGTSVISLGQSTSANGYSWLKVLANGQEGWVASKYLQATIIKTPSIPSIYPSGSGAGTSSGPVSLPQTAPGPSNPFPPIRFSYVLDWKPALPNGNNGAAQGSASGGYMEPFGCGSQTGLQTLFNHTTYYTIELNQTERELANCYVVNVVQGTTTYMVFPNGKELEAAISTYIKFSQNVGSLNSFGLNLGFGPVALAFNAELNDTTLGITITHNNQTYHLGVRLDLERREAGFTFTQTVQSPSISGSDGSNNSYNETVTYTHVNISGGFLFAVVIAAITGGAVQGNNGSTVPVPGG